MGYFNTLAIRNLKKDTSGRTVFYPIGAFGKGYILPDEAAEQRVNKFLIRYYQVSLAAIVTFGIFDNWYMDAAIIIALIAWFIGGTSSLVAGFPISNEKLGLKESYANQAAVVSRGTLWALLVCCMLFVVGGLIIAATSHTTVETLLGLACITFFGLGTVATAYMIWVKSS